MVKEVVRRLLVVVTCVAAMAAAQVALLWFLMPAGADCDVSTTTLPGTPSGGTCQVVAVQGFSHTDLDVFLALVALSLGAVACRAWLGR